MAETPYMYVFVRKDLPLVDQMVQVGHVCHRAGWLYSFSENTHLILLQVKNEEQLEDIKWELIFDKHIACIGFYEPDDNMGYTAIATQPIYGKDREKLKEYHLWTP